MSRLRITMLIICSSSLLIAQVLRHDDAAKLGAELNKAKKHEGPSMVDTEGILASKGNVAAQRKILCDVEFARDPADRSETLQALRRAGGWFAIPTFATFLPDTPANTLVTSPSDKHS